MLEPFGNLISIPPVICINSKQDQLLKDSGYWTDRAG